MNQAGYSLKILVAAHSLRDALKEKIMIVATRIFSPLLDL